VGPLLVAATRQSGEAFGAQHLVNGRQAEAVALLGQRVVNVVDRQVLLAQGDDHRPRRVFLGLDLRAPGSLGEELAYLAAAKGVAQHAEGPGRIAELSGRDRGGHALGEVGAQRFVLAVPRVRGLPEESGDIG